MKNQVRMPKYYAIVLTLLFCSSSVKGQRLSLEPFDVLHYKFNVALEDESDRIGVDAEITILYDESVPDLTILDFADKRGTLGMQVTQLSSEGQSLEFKRKSDQLQIETPENLQQGDTIVLSISFEGLPIGGLIISESSAGDRTFFAEHWPNSAHKWLPVIDHPAEKATCEFSVIAPLDYGVISNGDLIDEEVLENNRKRTKWKMKQPISPKIMVIGVAKFDVNKVDGNDFLKTWTYKSSGQKSINKFSNTPSIFSFIEGIMGEFPFSKCDQVESTTRFGGMENAGNIFYPESSLIEDASIDVTIAHEIAHQWFGDAVTEASWADLWISEGFATYFENEWTEEAYGKDSLLLKLSGDEDKIQNELLKKPQLMVIQNDFSKMDKLMNAMTYDKAAWVLRTLCQKVGKETFWQIVLTFYEKYKFKSASTEDFIAVANEVSLMDLNTFFKQWFYRPGTAELGYSWKHSKGKLLIEFEQRSKELYELDIDIQVKYENMNFEIKRVILNKRSQSFEILCDPIANLVVDPLNIILGDIREM